MTIAATEKYIYITLDPVNGDLASELGHCRIHDIRDGKFSETHPVAMDLDAIAHTFDEREQMIEKIIDQVQRTPVAVHSYNLTVGQRLRLRAHGVLVSRRLSKQLIDRLLRSPYY